MANKHPDPRDINSVAGSAIGAEGAEGPGGPDNRDRDNPDSRNLGQVAKDILAAAEYQLGTMTDESRSTKYAGSGDISYIANGALSVFAKIGKLMFSDTSNQRTTGAFALDQKDSMFFSSAGETKLGSLNISTVDGHKLNEESAKTPSTNYSPTKPWYKRLFPSFSTKELVQIAVLELLQDQLLKAISRRVDERIEETILAKDIGTIIIDTQEFEDRILADQLLD